MSASLGIPLKAWDPWPFVLWLFSFPSYAAWFYFLGLLWRKVHSEGASLTVWVVGAYEQISFYPWNNWRAKGITTIKTVDSLRYNVKGL